jgi:hypothetical protein
VSVAEGWTSERLPVQERAVDPARPGRHGGALTQSVSGSTTTRRRRVVSGALGWTRPTVGDAGVVIIDEPCRDQLRRIRTAFAAFAAFATVAAGAAVWEYARRVGAAAAPDASGIVFVVTGVHLAGTHWLRKRGRRADFGWRARLVLPDGVRPGLLGRWSRHALAIDAIAATGVLGAGLLIAGGQVGAGSVWFGAIGSTVVGTATVAVAVRIFRRLRRSGCVAVTSQGIAAGGRLVRWEEVRAVQRDKDGVHLHLRSSGTPRSLYIGGPRCDVADKRIVEVLEFYLATPHRRYALDTGPDQLALAVR